ncbi:MAG: hypothetical protein AB1938_24775 [Myxococcota bacterium]
MFWSLTVALVLAQRPPAVVSLPSARGYPLMVHGPLNATGLITRIRDAADVSWEAEILDAGWPPPPPDTGGPDERFDLYVDPSMSFPEAYVTSDTGVPSTSWYDQTSYMVLPGDFPNDAALFSTVAHELNHASQYALDAAEDDAFFEHTAVLVEKDVARDFATWGVGIADFQGHPERALTYIGTDWYEYGAGMWLMFLSERFDGGGYGLVQRLWRDSQQPGASNHPHFLDALDGILAERGWTRRRFFSTFSAWRYFTGPRDDGRHFEGSAGWGASSLIAVTRVSVGASPQALTGSLAGYGTRLFVLELPAGAAALVGTTDGAETGLALIPLGASGEALSDGVATEGEDLTLRLGLPTGTAQVLAALTRTPAAYDPSMAPLSARQVSASVSAEVVLPDGGIVDGGVAPPPADGGVEPLEPPMGCGCDGGGGAGWVGLALVLAARRRRR